jgi:soluble lytic murein transglycosylase-like protein
MAERCRAVEPIAHELARSVGVEPALVMGVIRVESGFRPDARSSVGATGLMQLMPRTASGLGCADIEEPEANIRCGVTLLRRLLVRFGGNEVYALSAYHAGNRLAASAEAEQGLPRNFGYVERVWSARSWYVQKGCGGAHRGVSQTREQLQRPAVERRGRPPGQGG